MGIPLSTASPDESRARLEKLASQFEDLRELLTTEGVSYIYKDYHAPPTHRARAPPYLDSRVHPEREPAGSKKFWREFIRKARLAETRCINHHSLRQESPLFTYAELFAGMGGFGVALDALGGRCIFCSELEGKAFHESSTIT